MRRRSFLAGLLAVAVAVAVACDPRGVSQVPVSPGSSGGTAVADLATLDEWHYVGEAGEPAFDMSVSPAVGYSRPAFRLREAGIVDVVAGLVLAEDGGALFTLPSGYRPSAAFVFPLAKYTTGGGLAPSYGSVNTSGNVVVENGGAFNTDVFWINLSFFLLPPTAAS